jgi:GntR family transcriptional regulator/MocR family aminotransferase
MKTKSQSVYEELKRLILEGKYKRNEKLPSKRKLAYATQVSIFTIQNVYDQLLMEGYIYTKEKIGYFVSEGITPIQTKTTPTIVKPIIQPTTIYDLSFKTNVVDNDLFPLSTWTKLSREVLSSSIYPLMNLTPSEGILELRMEIVKYLEIYRQIQVVPEQIIVGSGSQPLLNLLVELLGRDHIYAVENPGYPRIYQTLKGLGVEIKPIPLDESGVKIESLIQSKASILHITPAHQFPTGIVMPIQRRLALLQWAMENNRYIIEDDYDSEFRFGGAPVSTMFGLTKEPKVIYMNSFTKSLGPAFKMGYIVLPLELLPRYQEIKSHHSCTVPNFEQYILYKFMKEGHFDRHLNRTRLVYQKKLQITQSIIKEYPLLQMMGNEAGLHFMLKIHASIEEHVLVKALRNKKIDIKGLHEFDIEPTTYNAPCLVIGYSGIPMESIEKHIHQLCVDINHIMDKKIE